MSKNYAFGGLKQRFLKLKKEKVRFYLLHDRVKDRTIKVNLKESLWQINDVLKKIFFFLKNMAFPVIGPGFARVKNQRLYDRLQNFFMESLPKNISLFQNYHALIVRWGKEDK